MREIMITISPDGGEVTMDAEGFQGVACEETIKKILGGHGEFMEEKRKDEYFMTGSAGVEIRG